MANFAVTEPGEKFPLKTVAPTKFVTNDRLLVLGTYENCARSFLEKLKTAVPGKAPLNDVCAVKLNEFRLDLPMDCGVCSPTSYEKYPDPTDVASCASVPRGGVEAMNS